MEWINSKVLLYGTQNYIHNLVINKGKDYFKKRYICAYISVYLNHFAIQWKLTQHCTSSILQFFKKSKGNYNHPETKNEPKIKPVSWNSDSKAVEWREKVAILIMWDIGV